MSSALRCGSSSSSKSWPRILIWPERRGSRPQHGAHQHRLAGARCADEAEDLALVDIEIEIIENDLRPEANGDVARRKHDILVPCFHPWSLSAVRPRKIPKN
jgi:hypothetical protein